VSPHDSHTSAKTSCNVKTCVLPKQKSMNLKVLMRCATRHSIDHSPLIIQSFDEIAPVVSEE
jgi:hypothetical protein